MLTTRRLVRHAFSATIVLLGLAGTCLAGGFDVGGIIGGVMQSAVQAQQQQRFLEQQQLMQQQQQQYERLLELQRQQNAFRQQQYTSPPSTPTPQTPESPASLGPSLVVDGHTLGEALTPQNLPGDFACHPSEQFAGSQWCRSRKVANEVWTSTSVILSPSSTIAYYNKFFEDATFQAGAVAGEIDRLSALHHQQPHVLHMPGGSRDLGAAIATWGDIKLTQIDPVTENDLATGGSVTAGVLVDFLNNVRDSAKRGLPIYRIAGGAGYYWVARYDRQGKGSLRFGICNAQVLDAPKPAPPPAPVVVAAAPPESAPAVRVASLGASVPPAAAPPVPVGEPRQASTVPVAMPSPAPPPPIPDIPD